MCIFVSGGVIYFRVCEDGELLWRDGDVWVVIFFLFCIIVCKGLGLWFLNILLRVMGVVVLEFISLGFEWRELDLEVIFLLVLFFLLDFFIEGVYVGEIEKWDIIGVVNIWCLLYLGEVGWK